MKQDNVNGEVIDIMLRQLGAEEIIKFSSTMHIATFDLGDNFEVSYVFNISHGNKYFLQRMKPYSMIHGKFASYREIIDFITNDICKFRKAKEVNGINHFMAVERELEHVKARLEHIYLYHDVSHVQFNEIRSEIDTLLEKLENTDRKSCRIEDRDLHIQEQEKTPV